MDSLTQIVLGAAVGEATLGRKVGNKAMLWGAIGGTIPDLDVISSFFLSDVTYFTFHRGISHSILFAMLFAPIMGYLISKIHSKVGATFYQWTLLMFFALVTHPLLDACTMYGTGLFLPFFSYRVELSSIFIIDPIYTFPLIFSLLSILIFRKAKENRKVFISIGLIISTSYLGFTLGNKYYIESIVRENLAEIEYEKFRTNPTLMNNIMWRIVVKTKEGYLEGFYSHFDPDTQINWRKINPNHELLDPFKDNPQIQELKWATKGYYVMSQNGDTLEMNDLRFGQPTSFRDPDSPFIFTFNIKADTNGDLIIKTKEPSFEDFEFSSESFTYLFERIFGKHSDIQL